MNKYPLWKNLLVAFVLGIGLLYALPNMFGDYMAVQVAARSGEVEADLSEKVSGILEAEGLTPEKVRIEDNRVLAMFESEADQLKAHRVLDESLNAESPQYVVALNLVSAAPQWVLSIAKPMYLGLDLRGGVHFLMEVDMDEAMDTAEEQYVSEWKNIARKLGIRGTRIKQDNSELTAMFSDAEARDAALAEIRKTAGELTLETREEDGRFWIVGNLTEQAAEQERKVALQQNIITLRNRVNELGVAEPVIQQQGRERIVVQLPGVQDPARARDILGATATLEYRLVHGTPSDWDNAARTNRVPAEAELFYQRDDGTPILLERDIIVTGDHIKDASSGFDQQSSLPAVIVNLDNRGASRMRAVTEDNVGNLMAVVYSEKVPTGTDENGKSKTRLVREVISAATIRDVLSHRFQTTGLSSKEATNLALLLRSGALKAPVEIVEERTVGPSLGADNIRQGFTAALVGLAVVLVFMAFYYRTFGIIAGFALVTNLILIVAVLSTLQATLTLPGIAGIVLTTGMAVDANVLIFERIREELRAGTNVQSAISAGYDKAFSTIADANITTLIAAVILFGLGTGPVKGFAVTLCIGILTSMFTAIIGTRALVNWRFGGKRLKTLPI